MTIPRTHAYKVIFTPRPGAYGAAMRDVGYHSAYEPDAPSETVVSRPRTKPARGMTFRVPHAPPGVYLVLIFDGTEGGTHATWAYYHVLGRPPKPRDGMTASTGAPALPGADVGSSGAGSSARIALLGTAVAVVAIAGGVFLGRSLGRRGAIR